MTLAINFSLNNQDGVDSMVIVNIGYASKKLNNLAYQLELRPNESKFYVITADGQRLEQKQNSGMPVGGQLDLYMHFLKDIVLFGFSPDPSQWNNISPISQKKNSDSSKNKFVNFLPDDATINVQCSYASLTLKYGPLAFNNFDAKSDDHRPHITFSHNKIGRAHV